MPLAPAPLFTDIAPGPADGTAVWAEAGDGVRLRFGVWGRDAARGTVFLFPGRTEYVEKYGISAQLLADRGFATLAVDWRGQGLADRLLPDQRTGHVGVFTDYQKDIEAALSAAEEMALPKPYFLLAHSMGSGIGLRAVMEDMPVAAVAFTGPMWGIHISLPLQPVAWVLGRLMPALGQGHRIAPSTVPEPYVLANPFKNNTLTRDIEMWNMMVDQLTAHPDLAIGGPSYTWLHEALEETKLLASRPAPKLPCLVFLGDNERIVHIGRIHERMASWSGSTLEIVENAEHEVQMEGPETRTRVFDKIAAHFAAAGTGA